MLRVRARNQLPRRNTKSRRVFIYKSEDPSSNLVSREIAQKTDRVEKGYESKHPTGLNP